MKLKIKFFLILGLIILGLAGFGYGKSTPGLKNQTQDFPQIEITPQFFDFGEVRRPQVVEQKFVVKNLGGEALEIRRLSTSCGCTTAKVDKEKIGPGETAVLTVRYDSGAMSHEIGEIERIVYIKSNDPTTPQSEIKIYANVD